jgi:hypothetical protein
VEEDSLAQAVVDLVARAACTRCLVWAKSDAVVSPPGPPRCPTARSCGAGGARGGLPRGGAAAAGPPPAMRALPPAVGTPSLTPVPDCTQQRPGWLLACCPWRLSPTATRRLPSCRNPEPRFPLLEPWIIHIQQQQFNLLSLFLFRTPAVWPALLVSALAAPSLAPLPILPFSRHCQSPPERHRPPLGLAARVSHCRRSFLVCPSPIDRRLPAARRLQVQLVKGLAPALPVGYVVLNETAAARAAGSHSLLRLPAAEVVALHYAMASDGGVTAAARAAGKQVCAGGGAEARPAFLPPAPLLAVAAATLAPPLKTASLCQLGRTPARPAHPSPPAPPRQVHAWTANTAGMMRGVLDAGVDAVVTNHPRKLQAAIDSRVAACQRQPGWAATRPTRSLFAAVGGGGEAAGGGGAGPGWQRRRQRRVGLAGEFEPG